MNFKRSLWVFLEIMIFFSFTFSDLFGSLSRIHCKLYQEFLFLFISKGFPRISTVEFLQSSYRRFLPYLLPEFLTKFHAGFPSKIQLNGFSYRFLSEVLPEFLSPYRSCRWFFRSLRWSFSWSSQRDFDLRISRDFALIMKLLRRSSKDFLWKLSSLFHKKQELPQKIFQE